LTIDSIIIDFYRKALAITLITLNLFYRSKSTSIGVSVCVCVSVSVSRAPAAKINTEKRGMDQRKCTYKRLMREESIV